MWALPHHWSSSPFASRPQPVAFTKLSACVPVSREPGRLPLLRRQPACVSHGGMSTVIAGRSGLSGRQQHTEAPRRGLPPVGRPASRSRPQTARSQREDDTGAESLSAFPGEDAPGTGAAVVWVLRVCGRRRACRVGNITQAIADCIQWLLLSAGARHFPSPWQNADQQERRKPAESFDMRSASEVAEIFDSFQRAG